MDKIMNYVIFLCFIYLLLLSFKKNRSIFAPSNFFILAWFINYAVLMFFVRDYFLRFEGSAFLLLMCFLVYYFGNIGLDIKLKKIIKHIDLVSYVAKLKYIGIVVSLIGFSVYPFMINNVNGDILQALDLAYIKKVSVVLSYMRYKLGYTFPMYIQVLLGMNYFACLISGAHVAYLYINKKNKYIIVYSLCLITSILVALITTEKAIIIYSLVLFLSSFFVAYNTISEKEFSISKKNLLLFLFLGLFIFILFIYIQMNRYGFTTMDGFFYVVRKFKVYAFGHFSAFSIWFKEHAGGSDFTFGKYTFAGIFSLLHLSERDPGIFTDYVMVSHEPAYTNVYTMFRCIITDFSIVGACLMISVISYIAGFAYENKKNSIFMFVYLIGFYSFTLISFLSSMLNYNTIIGAFGLFLTSFTFFRIKKLKIYQFFSNYTKIMLIFVII